MGMEVLAYDLYLEKEIANNLNIKLVELEEGLKEADYITINAKLSKETEKLLGMNEFKKMKNTAYIINTARGKIINQKDLIEAVDKKIIAGAVLDVIEIEPPNGCEEIFKVKNILVTPHISYISKQSLEELKFRASNNVVKVLNGEQTSDFV